ARRRDRLDALAAELRERYGRRVDVLACDVADAEARAALPEALAREPDVLVLCAGFGYVGPFLAQPAPEATAMVRTNLEAVVGLCHALIPPMVARGRGSVLLVSSFAGRQPMPHFAVYAATKAAVTSLAEALHAELEGSGVTVTALCPGGVRTEFAAVAGAAGTEARMPASIMIDADECARAAVAGLEDGRRIVMPRRAVRLFSAFAAYAPRALWLPLCRRMMG
ncbi:MAG TPA: SDR family NAD(P)-dependent oxidoreductase, partial [Solirubrobacteraceae bacterium]